MKLITKSEVVPLQGEPNRFHVPSSSVGGSPYLVDLEGYKGNGECDCKDFAVHANKVRENIASGSCWNICKHIEAALLFKAHMAVAADMKGAY